MCALDLSLQDSLYKKFSTQGIPTLVLLDGATGELITDDGQTIIGEDPDGEDFPWLPKPITEEIRGKFIDEDMLMVDFDAIKGKTIGLFFHAQWVSPTILIHTHAHTHARTHIYICMHVSMLCVIKSFASSLIEC